MGTFQFSSVHSQIWSSEGQTIQQRSSASFLLLLLFCFLQEALVSSSGMGKDVHSLMLSIQHFLCRPRRRPQFMVS